MTFKNKMIFITMISIVSIIIMAATATIVIRTKNYENSEKWILTQQRLINSIEYQYRCYHTEMKVWDILFKVENINDSTIFQIQSTRERAKEFLHNAFLYEVDESGKKIIEDLKILNKQYEDNIYKVLTFLENEQQEEAIALFLSDEHQKTRNDMQELAHRLQDLQFSEFIKLIENSREYISNVTRIILLTSLIIVIGSIGLTGWLLRSFTLNVNNLTNVLNKASISPASNLQRIKVITNDEIGHIAKAYNHLVDSLEFHIKQEHEYKRVLQEKNWMQSKIAEIDAIFHEVENLNNLAEAIVSKTTPLIKANYGIFYIRQGEGECTYLKAIATYAYENEDIINKKFRLGEGLVGQCAKEQKPILLEHIPKDYAKINSGSGKALPRSIYLVPISFEGSVLAVLEFSSFQEFTPLHQILMEGVASNLGIMIDSITQQMQIKTLLEQSQSLTEELQSQSEQLQQQHEVLMSINEQLEKQNKESKIKTKELEETKKKLEEHAKQLALSSEFKSEFLANMSHELRTPLNSMLILTQILAENREGNLNQQQVEYAQSILLAGKDLLELINNILDLAKVEAGKMDIVVDEIHLHSFAKEMKQEFHHLAQKKVLISK